MTDTTVHPYFVDKARQAFAKAHGNPDMSGPLAEWAQHARTVGTDTTVGVIVGEDGVILADTRHITSGGSGATYVTGVRNPEHTGWDVGVENFELGLAMPILRRLTGHGVIHVRYSQVCQGAGRPAAERSAR